LFDRVLLGHGRDRCAELARPLDDPCQHVAAQKRPCAIVHDDEIGRDFERAQRREHGILPACAARDDPPHLAVADACRQPLEGVALVSFAGDDDVGHER